MARLTLTLTLTLISQLRGAPVSAAALHVDRGVRDGNVVRVAT